MKLLLLLVLSFHINLLTFSQPIVYVTPSGAGTGSGSSWADALPGTELAGKVATASTGTQFWIAAGTYKPTTTTDQTASFSIASGVQMYGGFWGTETTLAQRPGYSDITFLSGDIGVNGYAQDNSQHVVYVNNSTQSVVIDGLTITRGQIVPFDNADSGAGIYIVQTDNSRLNITMSKCRLIDNVVTGNLSGGGALAVVSRNNSQVNLKAIDCALVTNQAGYGGAVVFITQGGSIKSRFENCLFAENVSSGGGGAISNGYVTDDSLNSLVINRCTFLANRASFFGGAIETGSSSCTVENSLFHRNQVIATTFGGGGAINGTGAQRSVFLNSVFSNNSAPHGGAVYSTSEYSPTKLTFVNCNFIKNLASIAGGVFYSPDIIRPLTPTYNLNQTSLKNCLIWQNTAPYEPVYRPQTWISPEGNRTQSVFYTNYSLIQENFPGIGNLNSDPFFVDPTNGDFRLKPSSPAINAGDPNAASFFTTDIAGQPRVQGGRVDMGAYEFPECPISQCQPFTVQRRQ